jgi:hypothetical protein
MWRTVYAGWANKIGIDFDITSKHYCEVIVEKIVSGQFKFPTNGNKTPVTATRHDSCGPDGYHVA